MSKDNPSINEKHINNLRAASENRGLWYYCLLKEAKARGLDINFARKGIREIGHMNGETKYPRTDDLKEFIEAFMAEIPRKLFEMELVSMTEDEARIDFHYCPMYGMWKNFKKDKEDEKFISEICDIAMEVDRGLFDTYDSFEFSLGDTIAAGNDTCQICIKKVK